MQVTRFVIFVLLLIVLGTAVRAQKECIELKDYEFFTSQARVSWQPDTVSKLIVSVKPRDESNFLIPLIVKQLAEYRPACGATPVDERFRLLLQLYSAIRPDDRLSDSSRSDSERLALIRHDFQRQLNDDRSFLALIYSMDDGPLYGIASTRNLRLTSSKFIDTPFGKLQFGNAANRVVVTATSRKGVRLWSRVLKGTNPDRYLHAADLTNVRVQQTNFVFVAVLFVDGEKLTLYTRPDGRFMYYTHSW